MSDLVEHIYPDIPSIALFQEGDLISGVPSGRELDLMEKQIGIYAGFAAGRARSSSWVPNPSLSAEMRPPKFFGELRNISIIVETHLPRIHKLGLVVVADLYSTGRGVQASTTRSVTYAPGYDNYAHSVSRKLGPKPASLKSEKLGEKLLQEASESSRAAREAALRHVFQGGLPGHGR